VDIFAHNSNSSIDWLQCAVDDPLCAPARTLATRPPIQCLLNLVCSVHTIWPNYPNEITHTCRGLLAAAAAGCRRMRTRPNHCNNSAVPMNARTAGPHTAGHTRLATQLCTVTSIVSPICRVKCSERAMSWVFCDHSLKDILHLRSTLANDDL
jgi:hypothetical protein